MDKRATVIESIQKLLNLGVSDKEIAENLYDVGIDEAEAFEMIKDARDALKGVKTPFRPPNGSIKIQEQKRPVEPVASMDEEIVQQIPIAKQSTQTSASNPVSNEVAGLKIKETKKVLPSQQQVPVSDVNPLISNGQNLKSKENFSTDSDNSNSMEEALEEEVSGEIGLEDEDEVSASLADDTSSLQLSSNSKVDSDISALKKRFSSEQKNDLQTSSSINYQTQNSLAQNPSAQGSSRQSASPADSNISLPSTSSQTSSAQNNSAQSVSSAKPSQQDAFAKSASSVESMFSDSSQKAGVPFVKNSSTTSQPKSASSYSVAQNIPQEEFGKDSNFEELWKKGIVVAVNSKLAEMKHLKEDVDSLIAQKVEESIRKELYQFKVLIDSQKDLIVSSNREALEQKQKEIVFIIDAKIAELRQYNRQLGDNLAAMETAKKSQEVALAQVNAALDEARRAKSQMVVEMNAELIKSKSSAQAFLDSASVHLSKMDERINKALELEKNIAEGMLAQAEQRIEQLTISRADDLISELQVELNKMQAVSKKISPEAIDQKIAVLEEFKKQFFTTMQDSLNQVNSAIEELNKKNIAAQQALDEKTLAIDAKVEELTKFEKDFIARLGAVVENK